MRITIQLGRELCDHIRTLVHDELNEQKNRQIIEKVAKKIRGQLDQLSSPRKGHNRPKSRFGTFRND